MNPDNIRVHAVSTFSYKGQRPAQEDYQLADREKGVFVVADGFGGPNPGAKASQTACEAVRNFLFKEAGDLDATLPFVLRKYFSLAGNVLFNSLIHANRKVLALNKGKNVHEKGGASVIAGFIDGDLLAIAQVGLCSAWLYRGEKQVELVTPRSLSKLKDPFAVDPIEEWNAPLIALGMTEDLEPEIFEYQLQKGDWVIFNTDGIPRGMIEKVFSLKSNNLSYEKINEELNHLLSRYQYKDNASISLIIF